MINVTLNQVVCPKCKSKLLLEAKKTSGPSKEIFEVSYGTLECKSCKIKYPILAGVALLIEDVQSYLVNHVKGISRIVPDTEIPSPFLDEYLEAKAELQTEHIEEDLESERVVSLYLMNQYLRVKHASTTKGKAWWEPLVGTESELIGDLIKQFWDNGPMAKILSWMHKENKADFIENAIELGCGVGGLSDVLRGKNTYLGVDSSFASISLGRHLALGVPYPKPIRIPGDLLFGPVSRVIDMKPFIHSALDGTIDFIVGDLEALPIKKQSFDVCFALNAIDMLEDPSLLPELQFHLLKPEGLAIQSAPYIWHEVVASRLRKKLPKEIGDSARAAEWLYEQKGFKIEEKIDHLPWLFLKHLRQLEIYSVHLFKARKPK